MRDMIVLCTLVAAMFLVGIGTHQTTATPKMTTACYQVMASPLSLLIRDVCTDSEAGVI